MRILRAAFFPVLLLGLCFATSAYAHHGSAAYDKHAVTLIGTVTNLTLANPHSSVAFDVKDEQDNVSHWVVEFGVLRDLKQDGWSNDTLKPGDVIKVSVRPKKDGGHDGLLAGGKITYADGRALPLNPPQPQQPSRPIRW